MKTVRSATLAAATGMALVASPPLYAQGADNLAQLDPGLWQYTMKIKSQSGQVEAAMIQAQAELAKLPPERRKAIEQMMASRGVNMNAANNSTELKACLTRDQAARGTVPLNTQQGVCTQQVVGKEGNTVRVSFSCQTDPPSSGNGEITFISKTAVSARMVVDTLINGKSERLNMTQDGRWLGADCGGMPVVNAP